MKVTSSEEDVYRMLVLWILLYVRRSVRLVTRYKRHLDK